MSQVADEYGYDTERMFLMGHSAGGHLCALLALDQKLQQRYGLEPRMIRGVIGLSGVYDVRPPHRLLDTVFGTDKTDREQASPIVHAGATAPPFFLRWGERDIDGLGQSARELGERLRELQIRVDARELPGEGHNGYFWRIGRSSDVVGDDLLGFVRRAPARTAR